MAGEHRQQERLPRKPVPRWVSVYVWFSEGFATRDLIAAKVLLEELA